MSDGKKRSPSTLRQILLTKSRFKVAVECPAKLFYLDRPEYANTRAEDSFLEALANGGFQVGSLARCYFPEGISIDEKDPDAALKHTSQALQTENVTLFEAAFHWNRCYIRADILQKEGNLIRLFEVKAKSYSAGDPVRNQSLDKKGIIQINKKWKPYLFDLAFQTFVLRKALPSCRIEPYLYLADTGAEATVNGLNQKFLVRREDSNAVVETRGDVTPQGLGAHILRKVHFGEEVDSILNDNTYGVLADLKPGNLSFEGVVTELSKLLDSPSPIAVPLNPECKSCEFRNDQAPDLKSGYAACWAEAQGARPGCHPVYNIWNLSSASYFSAGRYFVEDLEESDLRPKNESEAKHAGLTRYQRQCLQLTKIKTADTAMYLDRDGLKKEMARLVFPLHFIDFETTTAALPFHAGRRPYETIAFQFSHHTLEQDGKLRHEAEYLHRKRGAFPNFDFVRALKKTLSQDDGTIFRYAAHENTVLNQIYNQLSSVSDSQEPDRADLMQWIRTITHNPKDKGPRDMVDLCEWVIKYFYLPGMGGSNSLKVVLPSVLAASPFLHKLYSQPIYGTAEIPSHNYRNQIWLQRDARGWVNPYDRLPRVFADYAPERLDAFLEDDIMDGGSAMMAFARMQFSDLPQKEADDLAKKLLLYCELDTLAMVMLFQAWKDWIQTG